MKRAGALLILLCLLTGCTGAASEMDRAMALRSRLLQAESCTYEVDITADYGEELHSFSMNCQADSQGNLIFTVIAPETIAGITGKISQEGGKLTFDDSALHFGLLADGQLTPVASPWIFLKTLRSGYLTSAGMEGELLRLSIDDSYEDDALHLDIWLNSGDVPVRAEILYDNRRILSLDVKSFEIL